MLNRELQESMNLPSFYHYFHLLWIGGIPLQQQQDKLNFFLSCGLNQNKTRQKFVAAVSPGLKRRYICWLCSPSSAWLAVYRAGGGEGGGERGAAEGPRLAWLQPWLSSAKPGLLLGQVPLQPLSLPGLPALRLLSTLLRTRLSLSGLLRSIQQPDFLLPLSQPGHVTAIDQYQEEYLNQSFVSVQWGESGLLCAPGSNTMGCLLPRTGPADGYTYRNLGQYQILYPIICIFIGYRFFSIQFEN